MSTGALEPFSLDRARTRERHGVAHDIVVLGAGLDRDRHLTREAEQVISSARVVFVSGHVPAVVDAVRTLAPSADLRLQETDEYGFGAHRPAMYDRIARRIVDEANTAPGVVAVQPGSAMVVDRITRLICRHAGERALRVRVLPGIGCVESVLAAVGHDVGFGVQVVLAQELFTTDLRLDPQWAAVVIQPAYFDTAHFVGAPLSAPGRFRALGERLGAHEHPDHPVALVHTAVGDGDDQIVWIPLGELDDAGPWLSPYHSMFVPARREPVPDQLATGRTESFDELLSRVESIDGKPIQLSPSAWLDTEAIVPPDIRRRSRALAAAWRTTVAGRA